MLRIYVIQCTRVAAGQDGDVMVYQKENSMPSSNKTLQPILDSSAPALPLRHTAVKYG
jgi:hypothetical protein